jgi:xanthine/uracil/vitamin C permease (AzgA family)
MGLNSYFTFGLCRRQGLDWRTALTVSFVMGVLFMALAVAGACDLIQVRKKERKRERQKGIFYYFS